jgi:hypothetical protein
MAIGMKIFIACFIGLTTATQFYAPPSGSPEMLAAQESYFTRASKILVSMQQAYQWQNMGRIQLLKSYKNGLFKEEVHPLLLEEDLIQKVNGAVTMLELDEMEAKKPKTLTIPAVPQNKELEQWMEHNSPKMLEEYKLTDVEDSQFEMASTSAKIAALKFLQIQLYMASNDVQKSYWSTKLMSSMAPPELAQLGLIKTFLSTVSLSLLIQVHDSFTFEAYIENFNDEFQEVLTSQVAEAVSEQTLYSKWQALAGVKMAMMYVDYVEMSAMSQVMQASGQSMQAQFQQTKATSFLETELKTEPVVPSSTTTKTDAETKTEFTGGDPAAAYQQMVTLQYWTSLLKFYNLMVEFQLAGTGSGLAQLKIMSMYILTNGDPGDDDKAIQVEAYGRHIEGIALPQLYVQWGQINVFLQVMEAYLMYTEFTISSAMPAMALNLAGGSDFQAQMQSVRASNVMESMNF